MFLGKNTTEFQSSSLSLSRNLTMFVAKKQPKWTLITKCGIVKLTRPGQKAPDFGKFRRKEAVGLLQPS